MCFVGGSDDVILYIGGGDKFYFTSDEMCFEGEQCGGYLEAIRV